MLRDVLIIGCVDEDVRRLAGQLRDLDDITLHTLQFSAALNGNLARALADADLAIICGCDQQMTLLEAIDALPQARLPMLLVCSEALSPHATRLLVRIGVIDILPSSPAVEELQAAVLEALRRLPDDNATVVDATIVSVFGATDSVDASFAASTLAHISTCIARKTTVVVDLDFLYSPIASMLGLRTGRGITEALAQLDTLDAIAIDGYVARHESGLKLLAENIEDGLPKKLDAASFSRMLNLIKDRHQLVVVAANRWLDEGSIAAAMDSRYVLIVLGQSLSDVRNAVRLRNLLIDAYGIAESSIRIVINRYSPRALVRSDMIVTALGIGDAALIPDDALLVRKSIDSGTPLVDLDRDAGITRAYLTLQSQLFGTSLVPEPGPIQRILATLSGSNR